MADHYQLNLGSLRSSTTLTLHTHHAARIWQGRTARESVHSIMGMAGYISVTNLIKQAAAQDDPYADWAIVQLDHGQRFSSPCETLDPYRNLAVTAALLQEHHAATGDWVLAVGRYHRPARSASAARYRAGFSQRLKQLLISCEQSTPP